MTRVILLYRTPGERLYPVVCEPQFALFTQLFHQNDQLVAQRVVDDGTIEPPSPDSDQTMFPQSLTVLMLSDGSMMWFRGRHFATNKAIAETNNRKIVSQIAIAPSDFDPLPEGTRFFFITPGVPQ